MEFDHIPIFPLKFNRRIRIKKFAEKLKLYRKTQ